MDKPNTIESVQPLSGHYSCKKDLRLNAWLFVATAIYLVTLLLQRRHPEWSPLALGMLALTPLIPGMLYVRSCLRFIRGLDELQRRIQLEAWLFASLGTLIIGTVINTLNANGVTFGRLTHGLNLGGAFALTFVLWAVGNVIADRRYR